MGGVSAAGHFISSVSTLGVRERLGLTINSSRFERNCGLGESRARQMRLRLMNVMKYWEAWAPDEMLRRRGRH